MSKSLGFHDVSAVITLKEFEKLKEFILENGDRKTYRNRDNDNPHYRFEGFDMFLGADNRQNINNNPNLSDFNEMVIMDQTEDVIYYHLVAVREGDTPGETAWVTDGMKAGKVYFINQENNSENLIINLSRYLDQAKEEMSERE